MEELIRVEDIEKYYGSKNNLTKAVDRISFTVSKGEFTGIMGASGSGKTTLLNLLATVDMVTSGHIYYGPEDITRLSEDKMADFRKNNLGFVFQDFNLLDTLTGYENIVLALSIARTPAGKIQERVTSISEKLEISEVLNKYPYQMSGGQKQRVAIARAISTNPSLILADEPTGALDSKAARMLLESFQSLNDDLGSTILMVTHDAFAASYCKRILFIKDGRIFNELVRGADDRKKFFNRIIEVVVLLGGDIGNVL